MVKTEQLWPLAKCQIPIPLITLLPLLLPLPVHQVVEELLLLLVPQPPAIAEQGPPGAFLLELIIYNGHPFMDHWAYWVRSHTNKETGVKIHATGNVRNGFEFEIKRNTNFGTTEIPPTKSIPLQWVDGKYFDAEAMFNNGQYKMDDEPVCEFEASVHKIKAPGKSLNTTSDTEHGKGKRKLSHIEEDVAPSEGGSTSTPPATDDKESESILDNEIDDHEIEVIGDDDIIVSPGDIDEEDFVSEVKTEATILGPTTVADGKSAVGPHCCGPKRQFRPSNRHAQTHQRTTVRPGHESEEEGKTLEEIAAKEAAVYDFHAPSDRDSEDGWLGAMQFSIAQQELSSSTTSRIPLMSKTFRRSFSRRAALLISSISHSTGESNHIHRIPPHRLLAYQKVGIGGQKGKRGTQSKQHGSTDSAQRQ
ncbi:hypothetical protein CNMCM5793_005383 [Aspergillus hiratsukae]|uniref:Uncharacterized protein n=1 Tax=Aspergillus hiratsukae TaxID=1194566 RepID=A0A8H6UYX3_9EURO|nr:hypothetical protein CNMCM5793_005383 [Aspergillus hiratsukae]KAF7171310.1 hypothetical protein CNMCM6106_005743 [Aspergillus hiratsukae]